MNCDVQFFRFSDYSCSPSSLLFSDFSDPSIVPHDSPIFPIIRFFRLYDSSDCYSPIFAILLVLHDSPILPILRFFRLLFSDFCDSPRSTRFSDFSDCPTILPIIILRFLRFSSFYTILRFFRLSSDSTYFPIR